MNIERSGAVKKRLKPVDPVLPSVESDAVLDVNEKVLEKVADGALPNIRSAVGAAVRH